MAKKKCPGCGAWYSGKSCPECYYTPFEADEVPTPHSRETVPPPRPISRPGFSQPTPVRQVVNPTPVYRPRQERQRAKTKLGLVIGVCFVTISVVIILISLIAAMQSVTRNIVSVGAEPEPAPTEPRHACVLYEENGIRLVADWDGSPITQDIPLYVQNDTERDIVLSTNGVAINGCMDGDAFFYCEAESGSAAEAMFWLDTWGLEEMGIKEIRSITFALDVLERDTYETLVDSRLLSFGTGEAEQQLDTGGDGIYADDAFELILQGVEMDEYDNIRLIFYGRNKTEQFLEFSTYDELLINGESTSRYIWQDFLPGTQAIFYVELYDAETLGIRSPGDVQTLEFAVSIIRDNDWESETVSDPITIAVS